VNILPREKQIEAFAAITEGVSVRATERLTGVNRGSSASRITFGALVNWWTQP